jgi:predicted Zn-dependent protease
VAKRGGGWLSGQAGYRRISVVLAVMMGVAIALAAPIFALARSVPPSLLAQAPAQVYPLPPALARWQDPSHAGDYFDQIKPVSVGYLVWSEFPITVFVEPLDSPALGSKAPDGFERRRSQAWLEAIQGAIAEWQVYLPLQRVAQPDTADISIWRQAPPLRVESTGGGVPVPRARTAETRFELYRALGPVAHLAARFTIHIRPNQPGPYTLATARHELGHALGIWGHSLQPADALYFSQVREPPQISVRDVNTLRRIYQQPTRLGR